LLRSCTPRESETTGFEGGKIDCAKSLRSSYTDVYPQRKGEGGRRRGGHLELGPLRLLKVLQGRLAPRLPFRLVRCGVLSRIMYQFDGLRKSTPAHNRSLFFTITNLTDELTILWRGSPCAALAPSPASFFRKEIQIKSFWQ
jgi:hypothetical protein